MNIARRREAAALVMSLIAHVGVLAIASMASVEPIQPQFSASTAPSLTVRLTKASPAAGTYPTSEPTSPTLEVTSELKQHAPSPNPEAAPQAPVPLPPRESVATAAPSAKPEVPPMVASPSPAGLIAPPPTPPVAAPASVEPPIQPTLPETTPTPAAKPESVEPPDTPVTPPPAVSTPPETTVAETPAAGANQAPLPVPALPQNEPTKMNFGQNSMMNMANIPMPKLAPPLIRPAAPPLYTQAIQAELNGLMQGALFRVEVDHTGKALRVGYFRSGGDPVTDTILMKQLMSQRYTLNPPIREGETMFIEIVNPYRQEPVVPRIALDSLLP